MMDGQANHAEDPISESRMLRRIRTEAALLTRRWAILEVVLARFGDNAVADLSPLVDGLEDLDRATIIFRLALRVEKLEGLLSALAATM